MVCSIDNERPLLLLEPACVDCIDIPQIIIKLCGKKCIIRGPTNEEENLNNLYENQCIASLEPATKGHNLKVTVISAQPPVTRHNAFGPPLIMREFLVGDATGCVILNLHNDQINLIEPGQRAILRNVKVVMVRGFMRLAVDKWGQIDPLQPSDAEQDPVINTANNISLVEYELVPNK